MQSKTNKNESVSNDSPRAIIREYSNCLSFIYNDLIGRASQLQTLKLIYPPKEDGLLKIYKNDYLNHFLIDFFENNRDTQVSISKLSKWFDEQFDFMKLKSSDWKLFLNFHPEALMYFLIQNKETIPAKHYWAFVNHLYTLTNFAHTDDVVLKLFLESNKPDRQYIMNSNERRYFAKLPEQLTIYRGCSVKEAESGKLRFSWTLRKKVAEFFAFKHRNSLIDEKYSRPLEDYIVVERVIDKSEAIAYFGGRKEAEIVYIPKN